MVTSRRLNGCAFTEVHSGPLKIQRFLGDVFLFCQRPGFGMQGFMAINAFDGCCFAKNFAHWSIPHNYLLSLANFCILQNE